MKALEGVRSYQREWCYHYQQPPDHVPDILKPVRERWDRQRVRRRVGSWHQYQDTTEDRTQMKDASQQRLVVDQVSVGAGGA